MVNSLFVLCAVPCYSSPHNSGCSLAAQAEAPNIVFITVDTTRADRMGFLGSKRGLTPNLDVWPVKAWFSKEHTHKRR